jgi:hypothetical protein
MNDHEIEAGEQIQLLSVTAEMSGRLSQRSDGSRVVTVSVHLEGSRLVFEAQESCEGSGGILVAGTSIDLRKALAINDDVPIEWDGRGQG